MAKKTKTTPAGNGSANDVIDIPHEEIQHDEKSLLKREVFVPATLTPEETAQVEIRKFNLADSAIAALNEKYWSLTISGPEDKEGYKAVREAWQEVRTIRTGLEKKGKELRDGYNLISKKIIKEEDRLVGLISPLEQKLHERWKLIDEEKERVQREKEEAEERQFMKRLEELQKFGLVLEGGFYSLGEAINLDAVTLRGLPEEQFLRLRDKAQAIFEETERKRVEAAEKERREREEFQRQQTELRVAKEKFEAEKAAMNKLLSENRFNRLLGLGMVNDRGDLFFKVDAGEITIFHETLLEYTNEKFEEFFQEIESQIKELKDLQAERDAEAKKAAYEKETREKFIAEQLEAAGFKYNYSNKSFEFKNEAGQLSAGFGTFVGMDYETIADWADNAKEAIEQYKKEALELEEARKIEAERERLGQLDDKGRAKILLEMLRACAHNVQQSEFKTKEMAKWRDNFYSGICDTLKHFEI